MRRTIIAAAVVAVALTLAPPASATQPPASRVTICHATGSTTHPYNELTPDIASSGYLKAGHSSHADDVIPPYTYTRKDGSVFVFEGQGDQSLLANDCQVPVEPPTCEELDNCEPPPCEGDDCNPPPPPRPDKSTYRIVTRMPLAESTVNFFADADIHIRYSCGREEFRVRLVASAKGDKYTYLIWMAGNSNRRTIIRVREDNVVRRVGRARC